uniref:Uncharacterized protein n=1 Tax=Setaria italica TaxID=4555 RepID=K3Y400_SETIT
MVMAGVLRSLLLQCDSPRMGRCRRTARPWCRGRRYVVL